MACRHFVDHLLDYAEERLPRAEIAAFKQHISTCEPCSDLAVQYSKLKGLCAQTFDYKPPANWLSQVVKLNAS